MKQYDEIYKARLIAATKVVDEDLIAEGVEGIQELVAYCARVSNPQNQINNETAERLLNYLIKHKHWSPLEMVNANIEIVTTRDIARQILRHRSFAFQEFSQRYADPFEQFDSAFCLREARIQDEVNRQNSIVCEDPAVQEEWFRIQQRVLDFVEKEYANARKLNIAKEQRRALLPEGNTLSYLYMNGSIRSWIHFIQLRAGNGTQKEHQMIALECAKAIAQIFPLADNVINN
jgi:thymidylate synthase (FAD)